MLVPLLLAFLQAKSDDKADKEPEPFGAMEVGVAADVLGLHFSEKELELMLPDVLDRLKEFEGLRAVPLANEVAPALYFLPQVDAARAPGAEKPGTFLYSGPSPERPADLEELAFDPIGLLHELVEQRVVSCVELTQMYLARLKRLDEKLHCVVTLTEERALAQARALDAELAAGKNRGILHGIPWVAKDLLAVKGYPTTWGTTPYKEQRLDSDAAVVERLDAAGAVLLAKVSLGELAMGDVWFGGKTRNPWKPEQGSSGSSAGTASAVAAGCAAFGIGSETLGSIVSPSTVCGNSSLRPTFGRVSRYGAMTMSWSMDKLGPIGRSAEDVNQVFEFIHGFDPRDPTTVALPHDEQLAQLAEVRGWKVGVPKGAFEGNGADCKSVLDELKTLGVELVDVELPKYPIDEMLIVLTAEAGAAFDDFSRSDKDDQMARQTRESWPNTFRQAALIPAVDYIRANRLRTQLDRDFEKTFADVRVLVHPSFAGSLLALTNLTGNPTFVAPCGFHKDGTPYSISFTGKLYGDADVLALAHAWQKATHYHEQHPKL
jgi:Asp-tRNA(Asn)/Glu-tRNA(Gln) amidotransferase A subunit family amidase